MTSFFVFFFTVSVIQYKWQVDQDTDGDNSINVLRSLTRCQSDQYIDEHYYVVIATNDCELGCIEEEHTLSTLKLIVYIFFLVVKNS